MTKFICQLLMIITLQVLLAGCGFTVRNINSLPPQLKQVYYQTEHPYDVFEVNLKKRLKKAGISTLPQPQKNSPIIRVSASFASSTPTSSSSTTARIYSLNYSATISVSNFNNETLVGPISATVSRSLTLQPDEVFEATSQLAIIKNEMEQELVTKLLNILSAPKTFQALKKSDR